MDFDAISIRNEIHSFVSVILKSRTISNIQTIKEDLNVCENSNQAYSSGRFPSTS